MPFLNQRAWQMERTLAKASPEAMFPCCYKLPAVKGSEGWTDVPLSGLSGNDNVIV